MVRDQAPPEDDGEFEALLAATMQESIESRKLASRVSTDKMAIPMAALKAQSARALAHAGGPMTLLPGGGLGHAGEGVGPLGPGAKVRACDAGPLGCKGVPLPCG